MYLFVFVLKLQTFILLQTNLFITFILVKKYVYPPKTNFYLHEKKTFYPRAAVSSLTSIKRFQRRCHEPGTDLLTLGISQGNSFPAAWRLVVLVNHDSSKEIRVVREVRSSRYRVLNYITRKRTTTKGKPFFDLSYQMAREIEGSRNWISPSKFDI